MKSKARVATVCGLTLLAGCITEDVVPEMVTVGRSAYTPEQAHTICYGAGVQAMEAGRRYLPVGAPTYNTNCQALGGSVNCNSSPSTNFGDAFAQGVNSGGGIPNRRAGRAAYKACLAQAGYLLKN